jgi:histone H3/H4
MKKRIVKKKQNRKIKYLAQKQRQKGNVTHVVWDSIEGINFSTMIYSNNKRSVHGIPKNNFRRIYKNIAKVSINFVERNKKFNKEALNFMNKDVDLKIDHMFLINTEEIKKEIKINDYCISGR